MKESNFLVLLAHMQMLLFVLTSGWVAVFFAVMAMVNSLMAMYYTFKEDKEAKVIVSPVVIEKEKV